MTIHNTAFSLFASTIAAGLGFAVSIGGLASPQLNPVAIVGGLGLLLLGSGFFVGIASRAVRGDRAMLKVVVVTTVAGVASVWFWLVPAKNAVMTVACTFGNFGACEQVIERGGFAADLVRSNDDFIVHQCETRGRANYCRLAVAKRLSHPHRFCGFLAMSDGFEVVEWCTPSTDGTLLVARR